MSSIVYSPLYFLYGAKEFFSARRGREKLRYGFFFSRLSVSKPPLSLLLLLLSSSKSKTLPRGGRSCNSSLSISLLPSLSSPSTKPRKGNGVSALVLHRRRPPAIGSTSIGFLSVRCFSALTPELKSTLDKVVTSHKVVLFMKGTKDFPQCGFSNTVVQILKSLNVPFETLNILENELLRQGLKEYSNWPTFPQLYIDGEFFGGCDITIEAYKSGELQELLEKAMCS
ncbi:Monothiol glutaredoxin-S14, chloroplastic [Cinnamomum micranthum f. kanehirae]|uniref:Monothiol glutaredoxin-S14, chloroplastic n=1 Tax=Cinnamomum micranthum f. kanehirae TaxID=337451 RepID=A0A3S3NV64_9MAGN|nr:Monothiol glutaredoxin-S14, chloroplastic [Cinnamomum micranthum f. kanehirae]